MATDLETAARAYADAQQAVADAQAEVVRLRDAVPVARQHLADAIVSATLGGMRQSEVVRLSGYSREQVRRILRAAGVESDRLG